MKLKTVLIMGLLSLSGLGGCNTANKGKIKVTDNPISESYGDSLIGKELISLQTFELYDKPNGKVIMTCDYENGYICIAGEIKEDWIRLDYIRPNTDKLALPFYGWSKRCNNDSTLFKVTGKGFPFISPYDENAVYEFPVYSQEYPQYPGGKEAIGQFLKNEVQKRYPPTARQMGIQGQVLVAFVVEKDGTMSDFRIILKSGNDEIDKAAVECIKNLPERWKPAQTKLMFDTAHRTVRCQVKLDVVFK